MCLPGLRNKGIRYLALGHLHSYHREALDAEGEYCYSGCLEGRGFDECGEKGFVLLDVQDRLLHAEFIPFARRTLHNLPVDITGRTTVPELREALELSAAGIPAGDLVKFTLEGTYTQETHKDLRFLTEQMADRFWFVKIKDESRLALDRESYENDVSLKGEFLRLVMASDLEDADRDAVIRAGLQALSGEAID